GECRLVVHDEDGVALVEEYTATPVLLRGRGDALIGSPDTGVGARPVVWTVQRRRASSAPALPAAAAQPAALPVLPAAAHDGVTSPNLDYCTPVRLRNGAYTLKGQVTNPVIWGNFDGLPTTVQIRLHGSSMILATLPVD